MYRSLVILCACACLYAQAPSDPQAIFKQAIEAQKNGRLEEAAGLYQQLVKSYPNIPELRSNLGATLAAEGNYAEAIRQYQSALKLKADPQVRLNLALAYYKSADISSAIGELKQVRSAAPGNVQAALLLADCDLRLGRNAEVVALLTPLQRADPDNRAYIYLLGTALIRNGDSAQGQLMIDRILKNGDSAEARLLMGTTKFMVSDFSGALADLQKAVELNPKLPDLYSYYGQALLLTGDQAGARRAFEQELSMDPNNFDSNLRMGVLLKQDQENERALAYLQHALQIRPGDFGVRYQIATIELANGNLQHAQQELEEILAESPQFLEAHVSLATVYFREKRKADGERERALVAKLNAARQATNEVAAKPVQ